MILPTENTERIWKDCFSEPIQKIRFSRMNQNRVHVHLTTFLKSHVYSRDE